MSIFFSIYTGVTEFVKNALEKRKTEKFQKEKLKKLILSSSERNTIDEVEMVLDGKKKMKCGHCDIFVGYFASNVIRVTCFKCIKDMGGGTWI